MGIKSWIQDLGSIVFAMYSEYLVPVPPPLKREATGTRYLVPVRDNHAYYFTGTEIMNTYTHDMYTPHRSYQKSLQDAVILLKLKIPHFLSQIKMFILKKARNLLVHA